MPVEAGGSQWGEKSDLIWNTQSHTCHSDTHTHTQFNPAGLQEHWFICLFKVDLYLLIHSPLLKEQVQPQTSGVAWKRLSETAFISLDCIKPRPLPPTAIWSSFGLLAAVFSAAPPTWQYPVEKHLHPFLRFHNLSASLTVKKKRHSISYSY